MSSFKFKLFLPVILWALVIVLLSGFPGNKVPDVPLWNFDKLVHVGMYAPLSFLLLFALNPQYPKQKNRYLTICFVVVSCVFYGGIMEILQHYIFINRSGNIYDFLANAIGSIIGVFIHPYIIKLLPIQKWWN